MGDRGWMGLVVAVALLFTAVVLFWPDQAGQDGDPVVPESMRSRPDPVPKRSGPRVVHLTKPGLTVAELPPQVPSDREETPLSVPDRAAFNKAVNHGVRDAKLDCIDPWLEGALPGASAEIVVNARFYDGQLIDIELRSLAELPEDVVECMRDVLWDRDWPTAEAGGDIRFQETLEAVKQ